MSDCVYLFAEMNGQGATAAASSEKNKQIVDAKDAEGGEWRYWSRDYLSFKATLNIQMMFSEDGPLTNGRTDEDGNGTKPPTGEGWTTRQAKAKAMEGTREGRPESLTHSYPIPVFIRFGRCLQQAKNWSGPK